jgi:NAD(P)-dependent dehydrogenase (short-subunit alcohol dehydrogenase family)
MSSNKIVLVTGSNKGIGYGIIEALLKKNQILE